MDFSINLKLIDGEPGKIKGFCICGDGSNDSYYFCTNFLRAWCQGNAHFVLGKSYLVVVCLDMAPKTFNFYIQDERDLAEIKKLIARENQNKTSVSIDKEGNGIMTISWKES